MSTYRVPRILVSGPHRSAGKTTLTMGLIRAYARRGMAVQPFKKGPDYIDPMWHTAAAGRRSRNLDFFMMGDENILRAFRSAAEGADLAVIEGNQGLHDGLDLSGADSSAGLAELLESPVVLVVDASRMNRGIASLLHGMVTFDPEVKIAGVILNRVGSPRHEGKLRAAIDRYVGLPVLGVMPKLPEGLSVKERHLGLVPVNENPELLGRIDAVADLVERHVDLDRILGIAREAGPLPKVAPCTVEVRERRARIAYASDRAFNFYYAENLEALEAAGGELVPFSPLSDQALPEGTDALYLGGGFPEVFVTELAANRPLKEAIRARIEEGMPVHAECGGLMYLCRSVTWEGRRGEMVGAIPADVVMEKKPLGLGYVELAPTGECPWLPSEGTVRCHEFHHSRLVDVDPGVRYAWEVRRGTGVTGQRDGIVYKNVLAQYAHFHHCGIPAWGTRFVELAAARKERKNAGLDVS